MTYAPRALGPGGRRLWLDVTRQFELESWESTLLSQACATLDLCNELAAEGGDAVAELRMQRQALARLLGALKLPAGITTPPRPRGGVVIEQRRTL